MTKFLNDFRFTYKYYLDKISIFYDREFNLYQIETGGSHWLVIPFTHPFTKYAPKGTTEGTRLGQEACYIKKGEDLHNFINRLNEDE